MLKAHKIPLVALAAALLATPLFAEDAKKRDPDYFFRPAEIQERPRNVLYPKGSQFFFSFYSTAGGTLETTREVLSDEKLDPLFARFRSMGLQLIGPQYELNERSLRDAEKHDFGVVYAVGIPMKFHGKEPLSLTPDEIEEKITEQVKKVAANERIKVWYLVPEELRYWKKNEVAYFEAATRAIREADPLKRPMFIYDPGHRNAESLVWIAREMDYLAKGAYTNYSKMKDQRIYVRWSIEQELEAFKEAGKEGVALLVPEMFQEPPAEEVQQIPAWVRHDVYLGLISGAKGILVFSARLRANFPSHEIYLQAYAKIAEELLGEKNLSQIFLFGERRNDITVDIIKGPEHVSMTFPGAKVDTPVEYPSLNFLDVAYGNERYLFIVNSANEPVTGMVGGISFASARAHPLFSKEPSFVVGEGEFEVDFQPLEAKGFRFSREK